MMLGKVDEVDGHFIATRFAVLCIPTGKSMYVTSEEHSYEGNTSRMAWSGVPVRFNLKSCALAYPRVSFWFIVPMIPFITNYKQNPSDVKLWTWALMAGLVVLAIASNFVGRLPAEEKERLRILGAVTGLKLDPSKLLQPDREDKRYFWEKELQKRGLETTPAGILAASEDVSAEELRELYAFACYSGDGPDWREPAARIYVRIKS